MIYTKQPNLLLAILFLAMFSFFLPSLSVAEENTCYFIAPAQDDIWVIVYSATIDGTRGDVIWEGKIKARQRKKIISYTGYIRYQFKREQDQGYEGDLSRMCSGGNTILL